MKQFIPLLLFIILARLCAAQQTGVSGKILAGNKPAAFATISVTETGLHTTADSLGRFAISQLRQGRYMLRISYIGYETFDHSISIKEDSSLSLHITLMAANKALNEVVVTGVSHATLVRENPVAIVSISSRQIDHTNESNIIDVLVKNTPGLSAVKTGPNVSKPFIRGLGYNRVLTMYDGVRQEGQQWGDEHGIEVDAYNIDKAEVIKGPASLMYGSDALAGVVSLFPYVPNKTDGRLHGKFTGEYQSNNNLIGDGLRLDYSDKHLVFAARGSFRMAKNYRNPVDGRVYLTNFSEKNLSSLIGYKTDRGFTHLNFTLYDNRQGIPDGSRDSANGQFTKQVHEANNDIVQNRPLVTAGELNAYKVPALAQHIQHYRLYLHSFYRLGGGDIDVLLAAQQNARREYNHPTAPSQAGMYVRLNTLNYGLRYNAPKWNNIEATIGINGMVQNNKSLHATDFPIPDYSMFDGGMYVYGKWKQDKWTISGGVRYDVRRVQWKDFYVQKNMATGFNQHVSGADTSNAMLQFSKYIKAFNGVSASIGFTYQLSNQVSLKANIGRAYRAPNITEMASNGLDPGAHIIYLGNRHFNPEFSLQEDIGLGARLDDVSLDVSVFNNNIQDYIYQSLVVDDNGNAVVDAQGNKTYQYQQAAAQLYGAEMWLAIHPATLKGFRMDNSLSLVYGLNKKRQYKNAGINGEYLPLIPPLKLLSSVSQNIKPAKGLISLLTPKAEMEIAGAQNRYLALNNTETPAPGYILLNCGIDAEIRLASTQTIQLQLQVNNLLDKAYQNNLNRLKYFEYYTQSPNGHSGIYNMGRNICVKMIVTF